MVSISVNIKNTPYENKFVLYLKSEYNFLVIYRVFIKILNINVCIIYKSCK